MFNTIYYAFVFVQKRGAAQESNLRFFLFFISLFLFYVDSLRKQVRKQMIILQYCRYKQLPTVIITVKDFMLTLGLFSGVEELKLTLFMYNLYYTYTCIYVQVVS